MKWQILVKVVYGAPVNSLRDSILQMAGVTTVKVLSGEIYSLETVVEVDTKEEVAAVIK